MQLAPLFPIVHRILKPAFPQCFWGGDPNSRAIALTFDDGPHPQYTPELLSVLDYYGIRASFFWLGENVNRFPEVAQAVCTRGHWIGLHGYDHQSFPLLTATDLKHSLEKTRMTIHQACGIKLEHLRDVRPPNGLFTPDTLNYLKQWNYRVIMWSVVPEDWVRPGVTTVVQRVMDQVCNGSVIVLHDGACGGQDVALTLQKLIPQLLQRGYYFVTVDTLCSNKKTSL